jgi:hypothetical protein
MKIIKALAVATTGGYCADNGNDKTAVDAITGVDQGGLDKPKKMMGGGA